VTSPVPESIAGLLKLEESGNRSLLFDRGMNRYEEDKKGRWKVGKEDFLKDFIQRFQKPGDFADFLSRREIALAALGVKIFELSTQTRLAIGLGLPNPTATGFLFDRLTGCPYVPGSSVKGLLRAAAALVSSGELPGSPETWPAEDLRRVFGPELDGKNDPRTGSVVFQDAFPVDWPLLELDVLTPHHGKYYRGEGPPGDWDQPVPVLFLTVAPGTSFRFPIGPRRRTGVAEDAADLAKLESLLPLALDWLGIGAKKASGYGYFGKAAPAAVEPPPPRAAQSGRPAKQKKEVPEPPPRQSDVQETLWTDVEFGWHGGSPAAFQGQRVAPCRHDLVQPDLMQALKEKKKKKAKLRGDVVVVKAHGGELRVVRVKRWRKE
jgi:CRISPR-associated protein Cmr6